MSLIYVISVWLKIIIISVFIGMTATIVSSADKDDWHCGIRLVFDSDPAGTKANYILSVQLKNSTGRDINGVSIIYKDAEKEIIGNSLLECHVNGSPVKPGSYGECSRVLQSVDGNFVNTFGADKWTEIVNTQLEFLYSVKYCEILGFSY